MRVLFALLGCAALAAAGRTHTTVNLAPWPLKAARDVQVDLDAFVTAVAPSGSESSAICMLGRIRRLGDARRGVKLPAHWFWILEASNGFNLTDAQLKAWIPALQEAKVEGLSIFAARNLTDASVRELAQVKSLRYLNLSGSSISDAVLKDLVTLPNLAGLDLRNCRNLRDVSALARAPKLIALNLSDCLAVRTLPKLPPLRWMGLEHFLASAEAIKALPRSLEVLHLRGSGADDAAMAHLRQFKQLRAIGLESCPVSDRGVGQLRSLKRLEAVDLSLTRATHRSLKTMATLKALRSLSLGGISLSDRSVKGWRGNPLLERLYLQDTKISAAGLHAIGKRTTLKDLHLNGVDDHGLRELAGLHAMERIYFHHCSSITDAGVAVSLPNMPRLKSLGLRRAGITDVSLQTIGRLADLEWLDLALCANLTDAGLKHLYSLHKLRQLHLEGCRKIQPAAIEQLKKALPNLRHVGDPSRMMRPDTPARPVPRR